MLKKTRLLFSVSIHDCDVDTFTVGGNGGSGKDTSNTGVRVKHSPSGASGLGRESRSQRANKIAAFKRMASSPEFQSWAKLQASKICGNTQISVEESVEASLKPENLKVEAYVDGKWEICSDK